MALVSSNAQFHVLAVDDSLVDRKLIERLLKTSSFNVTAVDSGSKALELLGLVRERNGSIHSPFSPVVIMSSENVPARINRCLEEGAEEFLLKPVKLSDVNKLKPFICRGKAKEMDCNNNKRKEMEQSQSSERTRAKYNEPL